MVNGIARLSDSLLLQPHDIQPSQADWEVIGVFNPAVAMVGSEMVMLVRVAERPAEKRPGWTGLPHWSSGAESTVQWVRDEDLIKTDARVVTLRVSGELRLTSVSHFQCFHQTTEGNEAWESAGELLPKGPLEEFGPPEIWIARSPDLVHWGRHEPILCGVQSWECDRVGSGTPPLMTDEGWLTFYHGSGSPNVVGEVGSYAAGAILLDRDEPSRVIARSTEPILLPTTDYETSGFVPNVVFPTAMLERGEDLQVFYGAADTCVSMTRFSKRSVLDSLVSEREYQS